MFENNFYEIYKKGEESARGGRDLKRFIGGINGFLSRCYKVSDTFKV